MDAMPERRQAKTPCQRAAGALRALNMHLTRTDRRLAITTSMAAVVRADFKIVAVLAAFTSARFGSDPVRSMRLMPRFSR